MKGLLNDGDICTDVSARAPKSPDTREIKTQHASKYEVGRKAKGNASCLLDYQFDHRAETETNADKSEVLTTIGDDLPEEETDRHFFSSVGIERGYD